MFRKILVASTCCFFVSIAAPVVAGNAAPSDLEKMRKAFSVAVGKKDIKAVAAMSHFPLAFSGYEHPDKVSANEFADEFQGMFFGGDAQLVGCLRAGKLKAAQSTFADSPWVIDCDGNEYYFGKRAGAWKFTAYENINE